jgi:hypothetical protein
VWGECENGKKGRMTNDACSSSKCFFIRVSQCLFPNKKTTLLGQHYEPAVNPYKLHGSDIACRMQKRGIDSKNRRSAHVDKVDGNSTAHRAPLSS